jgi:hypothetical protein
MIWHYLAAIVLIKTSLLGLGLISLAIACGALLFMRLTQQRFFVMSSTENLSQRPTQLHSQQLSQKKRLASPETRAAFLVVFKTAAVLHTIPYIVMVVKLLNLEELKDVVTMGISHLLLHHLFSALIAAVLTLLTLRVVLKSKVFPAPVSAAARQSAAQQWSTAKQLSTAQQGSAAAASTATTAATTVSTSGVIMDGTAGQGSTNATAAACASLSSGASLSSDASLSSCDARP